MLNFLLARLKEPSTHAGIGMLFLAASLIAPQYAVVLQSVAGLFGVGAAALPEGK
jgi:hypothetical protein